MRTIVSFLATLLIVGHCTSSLAQRPDVDVPSFRNDVLPVFSRLGCNSGACHGALAGKGGFRLSLHGYDPDSDWFNITRQARGRRLEVAEAQRSLILTKPTGTVNHKGGVHFDSESEEYQLIEQWIRHGAPGPDESDPLVDRVEIRPAESMVENGQERDLSVIAHFTDGSQRDVTHRAKFTSTDQTVARVDEDGVVSIVGSGEGAITAWYSSKIGVARVTSPFPGNVESNVFANAEAGNFIDDLVLKQLERINVPPSPDSADHVFVRRVFLDAIGTLPTAEEVEEFLSDESPDRRAKLIDRLLERPEYVDYWSYIWSDILLINGTRLRPRAVEAYYNWVRSRVEANTPWDEMVREVMTARGSSVENGATNFYALHQNPEEMAENASQAFLGLSIGCAKCHNHPLEKWTNDQYYAFASHFARVRAKGWGGDQRNGDGVRTVFLADSGELVQPIRGEPQPPTPLDGEPVGFDYPGDRREPLAQWMTSPDNPYFARAITNRIWEKLLGVGLVESVDDMRLTNPASNEELLDAAADYLVEHEFDLKELTRAILNSKTYQRSSEALEGNRDESRFYSRYYPKRLMAEVLLDAMSQVTDVPTEFNKIAFPGADIRDTKFYPEGTRAIQLYDSAVVSYFLRSFGRNTREIVCECQRSDEPSMVQVLHISNGDTLNNKIEKEENWLGAMLAATDSDADAVVSAYLRALSRAPTESELSSIVEAFGEYAPEERRVLFEDLLWGLMSSREFLFNH
ncbi:MAG: DUF1549 domain-containing protein [Planctomycetota bacterium]